MEAIHVTYRSEGTGSGIAVTRLAKTQLQVGVTARLAISRPDPSTHDIQLERPRWRGATADLRAAIEGRASSILLGRGPASLAVSTNALPKRPAMSSRSIINLHWISNGAISLERAATLRSGLVWTMHDMWPFQAGMHLEEDGGIAQWSSLHGTPLGNICRQAADDVMRYRKVRLVRRVDAFVAPSSWLASRASESALLQDKPIFVIPNPIPLDVYRPRDRGECRKLLGVSPEVLLVGMSAFGGSQDPNKGWHLIEPILEMLARRCTSRSVRLLLMGDATTQLRFHERVVSLGILHDDLSRAIALGACDVVLVPSALESFSLVAAEAQACGRPVVGVRGSGIDDVVEDRSTGLLASAMRPEALTDSIATLIENEAFRYGCGQKARRRAKESWGLQPARRYAELYEEIVSRRALET